MRTLLPLLLLCAAAVAWLAAHRGHHGIAQDLHQLLVCHAHVARTKKAQVFGPITLLDGQQLLQTGDTNTNANVCLSEMIWCYDRLLD